MDADLSTAHVLFVHRPQTNVVDLNAIAVNPSRPWLFAVGGDDQYARIFDIRCGQDGCEHQVWTGWIICVGLPQCIQRHVACGHRELLGVSSSL
eukprot:351528-Chlamydomonas_euryale.AAC.4